MSDSEKRRLAEGHQPDSRSGPDSPPKGGSAVRIPIEAVGREPLARGRDHLTASGKFQSDKYPWCPAGFVPLKLTDPDARMVLRAYANSHQERDPEFSRDLLDAIDNAEPGRAEGIA